VPLADGLRNNGGATGAAAKLFVAVGFEEKLSFNESVPLTTLRAIQTLTGDIKKEGFEDFLISGPGFGGKEIDIAVGVEKVGADAEDGAGEIAAPLHCFFYIRFAFAEQVREYIQIDFHVLPPCDVNIFSGLYQITFDFLDKGGTVMLQLETADAVDA
jgi:hypothetical protein